MLLQLLRSQMAPYRRPVAVVGVLQAAQAVAILLLPTLNADIIDHGVVTGNVHAIAGIGAVMLAVTVAQIICSVGAVWVGVRTATAVGRDLRQAIFTRVLAFSARDLGHFGAPSLITRTTNDVQQVQMLILLSLTLMVAAPVMCAGGVVMALNQDVRLSLLLLVTVPVLGAVISVIIARTRPLFRRMQERIDELNRMLREQITGVREIRGFVRDGYEQERFAGANAALLDLALRAGRLMALTFPAVLLLLNLSAVAVVWFGGHLIASGGMPIGALTAFLSYLLQILMSVMTAAFMFMLVPRAEVCAERIMEVLDRAPALSPPARAVRPLVADGSLDLRDVEFRYPGADRPVLRGIDLAAGPGEVTGIIGGTGSGKTTLLSLIPRLLDVTGGAVLVNGVDVRELDPAVLCRAVSLVPQRPYLFSGTVASNLRLGRPQAGDQELWRALDAARARCFVERMDGGLNARIGQGGANVSGGQRQRLAIARALVHRPRIYLFDDCFSALDYATAASLRAALAAETAEATVLIVAQRVTSIRHADRIVVLDRARVAATGTHRDLMDGDPTYREIVLSQMTEQEAG